MNEVDDYIKTYLENEELESFMDLMTIGDTKFDLYAYTKNLNENDEDDRKILSMIFSSTSNNSARLIALQKLSGTYKETDRWRGRKWDD